MTPESLSNQHAAQEQPSKAKTLQPPAIALTDYHVRSIHLSRLADLKQLHDDYTHCIEAARMLLVTLEGLREQHIRVMDYDPGPYCRRLSACVKYLEMEATEFAEGNAYATGEAREG